MGLNKSVRLRQVPWETRLYLEDINTGKLIDIFSCVYLMFINIISNICKLPVNKYLCDCLFLFYRLYPLYNHMKYNYKCIIMKLQIKFEFQNTVQNFLVTR